MQVKYEKPKWFFMTRMVMLIGLIVLCGVTPTPSAGAAPEVRDVSELPLTFPVHSPEMADYFNQIARPDDIAAFTERQVHLVPQVTTARKRIGFPSWAEAERRLPELADQIDIIAYNAEHWEQTPESEQENMPATVQRAAKVAHSYGLRFMYSPDRRFAQQYVAEIAPYVDIIGLQGQRQQDDPQAFAAWMSDMISQARASNPDVEIYAQVGATQGPALEMYTAVQTVSDQIDGISVWVTPQTFDILKEFVDLLRQGQPETKVAPTSPPQPTAVESQGVVAPTLEPEPTAVIALAPAADEPDVRTPAAGLFELPLTFPVQSRESAAYFGQIAGSGDIAAFPAPFVHLMTGVTAGDRMVLYRSWAEAEAELEALIDQIDLVGYNPEHWQYTPVEEQTDLPGTVRRAAEFTHNHGARFVLAPDRLFADEHLSEVAPHVDIVILQGQRLQEDPETFAAWVLDTIEIVRASSPETQIYVQVSATHGSPSQMLSALQSVSGEVDGIAVWSMPRSLETLQEFIALLRQSPATIEPTPTVTAAPDSEEIASAEQVATPAREVETTVQEEISSELSTSEARPSPEGDTASRNLPFCTGPLVGGVVLMLMLGVVFARRKVG